MQTLFSRGCVPHSRPIYRMQLITGFVAPALIDINASSVQSLWWFGIEPEHIPSLCIGRGSIVA